MQRDGDQVAAEAIPIKNAARDRAKVQLLRGSVTTEQADTSGHRSRAGMPDDEPQRGRQRKLVDPNTPGGRLEALLRELGMKKVDLGRALGEKSNYQLVQRWITNRNFSIARQRQVSQVLGLPIDYFSDPEIADLREAHRQRVWAAFCESPYAVDMDNEERRILGSIRFTESILPNVMTYAGLLIGLRHRVPADQVPQALSTLHAGNGRNAG